MKAAITEQHYAAAARALGCQVAAIKAVAAVESRGDGFLPTGEPTILFEPHIFHRLTNGRFSRSHPDLSYPKQGTRPYGTKASQHSKLQRASALDRDAALQSCSWGKWQVMGFNWRKCGYDSLQAFINKMYRDEVAHLESFVSYVKAFGLADELQRLDFTGFAYGFNGPGFAKHNYDGKMRAAYKELTR